MESGEQSSRMCGGAHVLEKPLRAEPRAGEKVQRPPQVQNVLAVRPAGDCAAEKPGEPPTPKVAPRPRRNLSRHSGSRAPLPEG